MASQDATKERSTSYDAENRWLLAAICFVTVAGVVGIVLTLYSPHGGDAAILAVMAGFVGAALAGLVAALKGARILERIDAEGEKIGRIDSAVNGKLDRRLTAQDDEIAETRRDVSAIRQMLQEMQREGS